MKACASDSQSDNDLDAKEVVGMSNAPASDNAILLSESNAPSSTSIAQDEDVTPQEKKTAAIGINFKSKLF